MIDKSQLNPTEKQLMAALERLIAQQPTNRELKQKLKDKKLKIVVSNVEKEAGLSNGAAKHYPNIKELIEGAEAERIHGASNIADDAVRTQPLYVKAKEDLVKAKAEIKKLKAELTLKDEKIKRYQGLIKEQAVRTHQMNVAMWDNIPSENKRIQIMLDVQKNSGENNVVDFSSRGKFD